MNRIINKDAALVVGEFRHDTNVGIPKTGDGTIIHENSYVTHVGETFTVVLYHEGAKQNGELDTEATVRAPVVGNAGEIYKDDTPTAKISTVDGKHLYIVHAHDGVKRAVTDGNHNVDNAHPDEDTSAMKETGHTISINGQGITFLSGKNTKEAPEVTPAKEQNLIIIQFKAVSIPLQVKVHEAGLKATFLHLVMPNVGSHIHGLVINAMAIIRETIDIDGNILVLVLGIPLETIAVDGINHKTIVKVIYIEGVAFAINKKILHEVGKTVVGLKLIILSVAIGHCSPPHGASDIVIVNVFSILVTTCGTINGGVHNGSKIPISNGSVIVKRTATVTLVLLICVGPKEATSILVTNIFAMDLHAKIVNVAEAEGANGVIVALHNAHAHEFVVTDVGEAYKTIPVQGGKRATVKHNPDKHIVVDGSGPFSNPRCGNFNLPDNSLARVSSEVVQNHVKIDFAVHAGQTPIAADSENNTVIAHVTQDAVGISKKAGILFAGDELITIAVEDGIASSHGAVGSQSIREDDQGAAIKTNHQLSPADGKSIRAEFSVIIAEGSVIETEGSKIRTGVAELIAGNVEGGSAKGAVDNIVSTIVTNKKTGNAIEGKIAAETTNELAHDDIISVGCAVITEGDHSKVVDKIVSEIKTIEEVIQVKIDVTIVTTGEVGTDVKHDISKETVDRTSLDIIVSVESAICALNTEKDHPKGVDKIVSQGETDVSEIPAGLSLEGVILIITAVHTKEAADVSKTGDHVKVVDSIVSIICAKVSEDAGVEKNTTVIADDVQPVADELRKSISSDAVTSKAIGSLDVSVGKAVAEDGKLSALDISTIKSEGTVEGVQANATNSADIVQPGSDEVKKPISSDTVTGKASGPIEVSGNKADKAEGVCSTIVDEVIKSGKSAPLEDGMAETSGETNVLNAKESGLRTIINRDIASGSSSVEKEIKSDGTEVGVQVNKTELAKAGGIVSDTVDKSADTFAVIGIASGAATSLIVENKAVADIDGITEANSSNTNKSAQIDGDHSASDGGVLVQPRQHKTNETKTQPKETANHGH